MINQKIKKRRIRMKALKGKKNNRKIIKRSKKTMNKNVIKKIKLKIIFLIAKKAELKIRTIKNIMSDFKTIIQDCKKE